MTMMMMSSTDVMFSTMSMQINLGLQHLIQLVLKMSAISTHVCC